MPLHCHPPSPPHTPVVPAAPAPLQVQGPVPAAALGPGPLVCAGLMAMMAASCCLPGMCAAQGGAVCVQVQGVAAAWQASVCVGACVPRAGGAACGRQQCRTIILRAWAGGRLAPSSSTGDRRPGYVSPRSTGNRHHCYYSPPMLSPHAPPTRPAMRLHHSSHAKHIQKQAHAPQRTAALWSAHPSSRAHPSSQAHPSSAQQRPCGLHTAGDQSSKIQPSAKVKQQGNAGRLERTQRGQQSGFAASSATRRGAARAGQACRITPRPW